MPKRILVADDQPSARELLRTILANAGYDVVEAADGNEAVDLAWEHSPDLILLDIHMPGRDGFAVCGLLRESPRFLLVPIVAMTAGLMRGERERAMAAGFSEFLGKPISIQAVREIVASLLAGTVELSREALIRTNEASG
jgi:CheY-like chemotaxis protein